MKLSVKTFLKLLVLGMSWTTVYALPFIQYLLYDPLLESLGCSNTQLGVLMTVFGLGNVFGAPLGGWLADRFDYRKIYVGSMVLCGVLSIYFSFNITYANAVLVWIGLAVASLVMNYPSHIKIVRMLADDGDQGKIFGMNESLIGLTSIFINAMILYIFSSMTRMMGQEQGFKAVLYFIGIVSLVCAVLCIFILKDVGRVDMEEEAGSKTKMGAKEFLSVVTNPATWLVGFGIFAVYSLSVSMSYFTPYFTSVMGGTVGVAGVLSLIRTYVLRLTGASIGGWVSDKLKSVSKVLILVYVVGIIGLVVFLGVFGAISTAVFVGLTLAVGLVVFMGKGCYYAMVSELEIPREYSASTIGVAAALGFSPDIFLFALAGYLIDNFGNKGYTYLFAIQLVILVIGIFGSLYALSYKKKLARKRGEE